LRTEGDNGYEVMAELMANLVQEREGYLGIESARSGLGITVSYWKSLESIRAWKADLQHLVAQQRGREAWYNQYAVRIAKVERAYEWEVREVDTLICCLA
jgi:heme-degrading monooxygenase HmoA